MLFAKCTKCGAMFQKTRQKQRHCDNCLADADAIRKAKDKARRSALQKPNDGICSYCGKPLVGNQKKYCRDCSYRGNMDKSKVAAKIKPKIQRYCRDCGTEVVGRRNYCPTCEAARQNKSPQTTATHPSGLTLDELAKYAQARHTSYGKVVAYYRDTGRLP